MDLKTRTIQEWPRLAWVAALGPDVREITVWHGPSVERGDGWCAEAVWAGDFAAGDFDRTDLVFGTGVRCRSEAAMFVSSGSVLDVLWYTQSKHGWYVSNSLPALLAAAGLSLRDFYREYPDDYRTIRYGLKAYKRALPADPHDVRRVYFDNLRFDGSRLEPVAKPDAVPPLRSFGAYHEFLLETARALGANMTAPARRERVEPLTTVSSGYDSGAVAVIAREAGCRRAVTLTHASSLWRGSDSGEAIARRLGLGCQPYPRTALHYPHEEAVWAVTGRPALLNWTLFDYPQPLSLLMTGCHGDKMWDRAPWSGTDPFVLPSVAEHGLGEFRLIRGVFHCPMPHWGVRHIEEVRGIGVREEMAPWTLGTGYDRPIARRILEEAGVPRGTFARRKKNASHEVVYLWPFSEESDRRFRAYLASRGVPAPSPTTVWLYRRLSLIDKLIYMNVTARCRLPDIGLRLRIKSQANHLLFQWANHELKKRYEAGLKDVERELP